MDKIFNVKKKENWLKCFSVIKLLGSQNDSINKQLISGEHLKAES